MFTGLVEEIGSVAGVRRGNRSLRMRIHAPAIAPDLRVGDSVAVDGVCQTVSGLHSGGFEVDVLEQTLRKTTLGSFAAGTRVHLERALRIDGRLGGHLVQGHVETTGRIVRIIRGTPNWYAWIELPPVAAERCVNEGSICLDGVSLTVARTAGRKIAVNLVPATLEATLWSGRRAGQKVNVETDVLAKYLGAAVFGVHSVYGAFGAYAVHGRRDSR